METKIIHAEIISPLCIWNGKDWTGLDFFINGNSIYIIDQNRIESALENYSNETNDLLKAISNGNGKRIDEIKNNLGIDFFQNFIKYQFNLGESAKKTLSQGGNSNNQGIIKQQYSELFDNNKLLIPGSTLKGIFRTAYLLDKVGNNGTNFENEIKDYDKMNGELNKNLFNGISIDDAEIKNIDIKIQTFESKSKPVLPGRPPKRGISLITQSIVSGNFDIKITINPNDKNINISNMENIIKNYSELLISREETIIDNINYGSDFLDKLDSYGKGQYPIKLGMYKKSLTYKIWWEDMIRELNLKFHGKYWLNESRKQGIGDKTLYIDEEGNPVGRIVLSFD